MPELSVESKKLIDETLEALRVACRKTMDGMCAIDNSDPGWAVLQTTSRDIVKLIYDVGDRVTECEHRLRELMSVKSVYHFWNQTPCNIRHSNKQIGTKEYFDEVEAKKYRAEPHIPGFADFARWKGKRVLEIGCGIGTAAVGFARAGADYTGIDLTDSAIALANQRFENEGLTGKFYVMNAEDSLPNDGPYDLVYSFGVIHHTPNPVNVIRNITGVLAEDGELRMMLYSKWSYKLFWMMKTYDDAHWTFDDAMDGMVAKYSEAQSGCPITHTYTFNDVKSLLGQEFTVTKIWKDHIFPYEIGPYRNGEYVVVPEFKNMSEERFASMCEELGWHTMVIAKPTSSVNR